MRPPKNAVDVAQTSKSAVSRISKSADFPQLPRPADLEVGDTAGLETCATQFFRSR
jgi:hypothetical protein